MANDLLEIAEGTLHQKVEIIKLGNDVHKPSFFSFKSLLSDQHSIDYVLIYRLKRVMLVYSAC